MNNITENFKGRLDEAGIDVSAVEEISWRNINSLSKKEQQFLLQEYMQFVEFISQYDSVARTAQGGIYFSPNPNIYGRATFGGFAILNNGNCKIEYTIRDSVKDIVSSHFREFSRKYAQNLVGIEISDMWAKSLLMKVGVVKTVELQTDWLKSCGPHSKEHFKELMCDETISYPEEIEEFIEGKWLTEATIREHKAELLEVLREVKRDATGQRLRRFPTRYSPSILSHLRGGQVESQGIGHSIRQVHDFYGWMAKAGANRGNCAGALYRTLGYLHIDRTRRDGSKQLSRNVHIEHTVPVCVLEKVLYTNLPQFRTVADLHHFLIAKSICVAFSSTEEKWLCEAGIPRSMNSAFDSLGVQQHDYPFRRYIPLVEHARKKGSEFRIFNVVSGAQVDLQSYSFMDHVATLEMASRLVTDTAARFIYDLELFGKVY